MKAAYAKSGLAVAKNYGGWKRYSTVAYQSATHGGRFVQNYANAAGKAYGQYEKSGKMPVGTYLVKDSFTVTNDGKIGVGPLFVMRKMKNGWHAASGDWKYAMVMPNGAFMGETKGRNSKAMQFCITCHVTVAEDQDSMFFLPEELRRN
ncbi:MAG: cytochrome P460 family protein [Alphaproteobacteria bacterium]|nr:cytochrome P460 family protein [Alphaproteobacteria bacterium]